MSGPSTGSSAATATPGAAGSAAPGSSSSLAFSNPSSGKIDQQRKILEQLERQKKLLNAGNNSSGSSDKGSATGGGDKSPAAADKPAAAAATGAAVPTSMVDPFTAILTSNQRTALETAAKTSFGYYIAQDSSFGNTILPVVPRFPPQSGGSSA